MTLEYIWRSFCFSYLLFFNPLLFIFNFYHSCNYSSLSICMFSSLSPDLSSRNFLNRSSKRNMSTGEIAYKKAVYPYFYIICYIIISWVSEKNLFCCKPQPCKPRPALLLPTPSLPILRCPIPNTIFSIFFLILFLMLSF